LQVGGQEHFYLETNTCVVIPHENDEFTIVSSTQARSLFSQRLLMDVGEGCERLGVGQVGVTRNPYVHPPAPAHSRPCAQAPAKHQKYVASTLGIPCNRVVSKAKRLGGGFGGKETRGASVPR
jgi:xanthine dehydrogenase/oxidase